MRFIYLSIIALVAISCSESKMLQRSLSKYNAPIGYLHDSKKTDCPVVDSIIIRLNNKPLDSITSVSKINGLVLPFIVFNYTEVNMRVKLGQSSIQQQYNDFFASSLMEESKRTGCFGITNQKSNDSIYTLDIIIDTCKTNSKYQMSTTVLFLFFAYSMSFSEMGFPAETNLQVSTKLRKGNSVVSEKIYSIKRTQPFLNSRNVNVDKLRSDFTANMVESLSLCTKQCIENMVIDINNVIKK
jgi:hypothetical protein